MPEATGKIVSRSSRPARTITFAPSARAERQFVSAPCPPVGHADGAIPSREAHMVAAAALILAALAFAYAWRANSKADAVLDAALMANRGH